MLAVQLHQIIVERNSYSVPVGNFPRKKFPSKRAANAFASELTRRVNAHLRELNEIYRLALGEFQGHFLSLTRYQAIEFARLKGNFDERMIFITCLYSAGQNGFVIGTCNYLSRTLGEILELFKSLPKVAYTSHESALRIYESIKAASWESLRTFLDTDTMNMKPDSVTKSIAI